MRTYTKIVTPKLASEWAKKIAPEKQRKLDPRTVSEYATAMRNGYWALTHQGIAFDATGNLCDGQHRIMAVIESGATVTMQVTEGMPEKQGDLFTFDMIDGGKKRPVGTQLQVRHGVQNANNVAAAARVIASICTRTSVVMNVANTLAVIDYFGKDIAAVIESMQLATFKKAGVLAGLAFARRAMGTLLDEFIARVGDGDGVKSGSPAYAYRSFILRNNYREGLPPLSARAAATCAMHSILGNKVKQVKNTMIGIDFFCDKQPRVVENIRKMFVA